MKTKLTHPVWSGLDNFISFLTAANSKIPALGLITMGVSTTICTNDGKGLLARITLSTSGWTITALLEK